MFPNPQLHPTSWYYTVPNMYCPNYSHQIFGHPMMYPRTNTNVHTQQYQIDPGGLYYPYRTQQYQMDPGGPYYPYRIQQSQMVPLSQRRYPNIPAQQSTTSPTLRSIEIRTETSSEEALNGEETSNSEESNSNVSLTSQTYEHMNQFISNLVEDVNSHNSSIAVDGTDPDSDAVPGYDIENEGNNTVSIMDLQNHTQLETFDASNMPPDHCNCSICHNSMDGYIVRVLRCSHTFHNGCIDRWLHSASTCPLCRTPIVPDEEEHLV